MESRTNGDTGFEQLLGETVKESALLVPHSSLVDGRFVVGRMLGSGGMGVVYEVFDRERDMNVALKLLTSVDASAIYRLKQEFRSLADIVHPHLVGLHELFCDRNRWFFTMDLVPGDTLFAQPVVELDDPDVLRSVFAQLATGIQAIHEAGKLHRDLKPSNVMLTPEGRVVIMDFGLASDQKVGGVGQTIVDDRISGTPQYMAPEQAAAEPATVASDWYAFGVILFEALTGKPPFEGGQQAVLIYKQQEDAPQPSSINPDIPEELEQLCIALLQRNPENRPRWQQIIQVLGTICEPFDSVVPQEEEIPFVGRVEELEALEQAFRSTDRRSPVAVFVHGVSGVGKTALVRQFLSGLHRRGQAVVLTGRCYERESVPFKACDSLIDSLSRYLRKLPRERAGNLLPRQVHAVAQLFPALQRLDFIKKLKQRYPLPPDPNELRRAAFDAFKELLTNIAEQEPLVLFIDDLQWSDIDGAKLLSSALSRPDPPSLLLIGAYRSEEADSSIGLSTLRKRVEEFDVAEAREIELGELSGQESQKLASVLLPDKVRNRASQIAREARGNPFFIAELARFASLAPDYVRQVRLDEAIESRLATLTSNEREVLEVICVSARPVEQHLLRSVMKMDDTVTALRRLHADHFIRYVASGGSSKVRTYHDRIRESVVTALDDERLISWHSKLAQGIEVSNKPDLIALTEHLLGAGDKLKAGYYARQAADVAAQTLAFENAARLYNVALDLNRGDRESQRKLQTKLGRALANAGRGAEAASAFIRAAEGASTEEQIELRHLAAHHWITTGHIFEGTGELDKVLMTVGMKLYSGRSASIRALLTNRARIKLHGIKFRERQESEVAKMELLKLRACRSAAQGLYAADTFQGAAFSSRFLRLALKSGIIEQVILGLCVETLYRAAEGTQNRTVIEEYLKLAQQLSQRVKNPEGNRSGGWLHNSWVNGSLRA